MENLSKYTDVLAWDFRFPRRTILGTATPPCTYWLVLKWRLALLPLHSPSYFPIYLSLSVGIKVCVESCAHFDTYYWNSFRCLQKTKNFRKELTSRLYPWQEFKERHWRSKTLIIPSLIRTQHCNKRQWLRRCSTKLKFGAAELIEFRWLVYISNFIKQNYPVEFYVHDDAKLIQPILLCNISGRN